MEKGLVIKSTGSWYTVKATNGKIHDCRLKGKFRIKGIRNTNPIAVGDFVDYELAPEANIISHIHKRRNFIIRKSSNLSKKSQIIAANIDQAFLIVTINYPVTTTTFIDRFLASAEAYGITVKIIFNKIDRYNEKDNIRLNELKNTYNRIGYKCFEVSATANINLDLIKKELEGKINVLSGHSGVGKSTLINAIEPDLDLRTGEISEAHSQGRHTTTFSEMFDLENGGYIIDTPGIRGFGIIDMENDDISHYFPELFEHSKNCQYNNCKHIHEPKCAVKNAIEEGLISYSRYESYLSIILDNEDDNKYR